MRQPLVAELIAAELRERILAGRYDTRLPPQEALIAEFRVGAASTREALRILETEGLISVRRGNVGGATVHRPDPQHGAYMLGLVLQGMRASVQDVRTALEWLEPACVAACARRPDRMTEVVPRLREVQTEAAARIDQPEAYMRLSRLFHTQLVALCGNVTMIVTVGALEALWAAQVEELAFRGDDLGSFGDPGVRRTSNREHESLLRHIEHGRTRPAEDAARRHFSERWQYPFDPDQVVVAARLRRLSGRRTTSTTS